MDAIDVCSGLSLRRHLDLVVPSVAGFHDEGDGQRLSHKHQQKTKIGMIAASSWCGGGDVTTARLRLVSFYWWLQPQQHPPESKPSRPNDSSAATVCTVQHQYQQYTSVKDRRDRSRLPSTILCQALLLPKQVFQVSNHDRELTPPAILRRSVYQEETCEPTENNDFEHQSMIRLFGTREIQVVEQRPKTHGPWWWPTRNLRIAATRIPVRHSVHLGAHGMCASASCSARLNQEWGDRRSLRMGPAPACWTRHCGWGDDHACRTISS